MKRDERCIAIYSRKSKFTGKGESIGNQVELCTEYITSHYGQDEKDNVQVFEDEGFSGKNLNRPAFKKMIDLAKAKKIKMIVVYRLDRISRNIGDFANLIEELSRLDVTFISIREQFGTDSPMARAMMYVTSVFSQLERETIAERIRDNMYELAKTGRWLGGNTPTGFTSESVETVTLDGKTRSLCKLKEIPSEKSIIKLIYQLYRETDSLTLTEAELINRGIKTKNGNHYTRFSIKTILKNPVYMTADETAYSYFTSMGADVSFDKSSFDGEHGIMAYNRTDQEKGRATIYLPVSEWIVSVGLHQGFIQSQDWIAVQNSLERNKSKQYKKPRINEALLTGLIFCSCGSRMYPKLTTRKTKDGKAVFFYMCKSKERSKRALCSNKNISGNALDALIIDQIKMLDEDDSVFTSQIEKSKKYYTGDKIEYDDQLAVKRKEKADLEKKMSALIDSLADISSDIARNHISKRIEDLGVQLEKVNGSVKELEDLTSKQSLTEFEFDLLKQLLSTFKDSVDNMTVEQKRTAIRTIVRKVVWDGTNVHVVLFGSEGEIAEYPSEVGQTYGRTEDDNNEDNECDDNCDLEEKEGEDEFANERVESNTDLGTDSGDLQEDCLHTDGKVPWGEDSKYYTIPNETIMDDLNLERWRIIDRYSKHIYLMLNPSGAKVFYSPLYVHKFRPILAFRTEDTTQLNSRYKRQSGIYNVFDKMKWCRLDKGLMQKDVAKMIGTTRSYYQALESGKIEQFNLPLVERLSKVYEVSVDELLDDYNKFIHYEQGKKIFQYREKMNLGRQSFADFIGTDFKSIRDWEEEVRPISKHAWEKYFKNI